MYYEIEKRNEAIQLLKNFVKLSSVLLPYYAELKSKEELSTFEKLEKLRLENIYENYSANTNASIALINSNVLEMIKNTFDSMTVDPESPRSRKLMREFKREWRKLRGKWDKHLLN